MNLPKLSVLFAVPFVLNGCLYGQCMDGACALERAAYLKSIKAYGEYWTKPDMTKEGWRQDWVAYGGEKDGNYVADARLSGETNDFGASRRKIRGLSICMREKGYEYNCTGS